MATVTSLLSPQQRRRLMSTLGEFYAQPVARVSFELLVTVAAVLFFAIFAIRPTLLTMSDLIQEIEEKRELDDALTRKIAALNTAQSQYLVLQDRLGVVDEAIPNQPEVVSALTIIEKLASDRQLAISSLSISPLPEDTDPTLPFSDLTRRNVLVSFTVSSDYPTIRDFVADLRTTRRSFVVDTVSFITSDQRGERTLRATITVNVPYFGVAEATPRPAGRTAAPAPVPVTE